MGKTISGHELRDRLLAKRHSMAFGELAWLEVMAHAGHRELLSIIAHQQPQSISALAEAAGRLQPNVSRSLSALMRAGVVEVTANGRAAVPSLTPLGREKAIQIGLLVEGDFPVTPADPAVVERIQRLVQGVEVDLDARLSPQDE